MLRCVFFFQAAEAIVATAAVGWGCFAKVLHQVLAAATFILAEVLHLFQFLLDTAVCCGLSCMLMNRFSFMMSAVE